MSDEETQEMIFTIAAVKLKLEGVPESRDLMREPERFGWRVRLGRDAEARTTFVSDADLIEFDLGREL